MKIEPEFRKFFADNAEHKRYDYPELNENSFVMDVGAYKGKFAENIIRKYGCSVYGYEPVPMFYNQIKHRAISKYSINNYGILDKNTTKEIIIDGDATSNNISGETTVLCKFRSIIDELNSFDYDIDLLKINIEGDEFPLLQKLLEYDNIERINNIQVQFHNFIEDCETKRNDIVEKLKENYKQTWCYYFVWENWRLNK